MQRGGASRVQRVFSSLSFLAQENRRVGGVGEEG